MKTDDTRGARLALGLSALLLPLVLAACGVTRTVHRQAFDEAKPRRIAILPFYSTEPGERHVERALYTREVFQEQLTVSPFAFLALDVVDARLDRAGLETQRPMEDWDASQLAMLQVDAVLTGEIEPYSATDVGLFAKEGIEGRFRLVSVPGGEVLWEAEHTFNNFGGLILGSGQVIREIRRFANSSDELYVRAVDEFVSEVVEAFPSDLVAEEWQTEPLEITRFEVVPSQSGTLRAGDAIVMTVEGTPGMRVAARCGPLHHVPLFETEPGRYSGSHIIVRGEQFVVRELEAVLESPFGGVMTDRLVADAAIVVDSRPPAVKAVKASAGRVVFELEDPEDGSRFVLETSRGVWKEGRSPVFELAGESLPEQPLYGYAVDAIGNRGRAILVERESVGAES